MGNEVSQEEVSEVVEIFSALLLDDVLAEFDENGTSTKVPIQEQFDKNFESLLDKMSEATGKNRDQLTDQEIHSLKEIYNQIESQRWGDVQAKFAKLLVEYCPEELKEIKERSMGGLSQDDPEFKEMVKQAIEKLVIKMVKFDSVDEELEKIVTPSEEYLKESGLLHREIARSFDDDSKEPKERLKEARDIVKKLEKDGAVFSDKLGNFVAPSDAKEARVR